MCLPRPRSLQSRFPHFRALKPYLHKPTLTYRHEERPFTFMRWKEKFVVPDHNAALDGASFAGFYYIAVDWSRQREPTRRLSQHSVPRHPPSLPSRRLSSPALVSPPSPTMGTRPLGMSAPSRAASFSHPSGTPMPRFSYAAAVRGRQGPSPPPDAALSTSPTNWSIAPASRPTPRSYSTSAASVPIPIISRSPLSSTVPLPPPSWDYVTESESATSKADENGSSALSVVDDDEFPPPRAAISSPAPWASSSSPDERQRRNSSHSPCREKETNTDEGLGYRGPWQEATMTGF
jgi:hypothetical protein